MTTALAQRPSSPGLLGRSGRPGQLGHGAGFWVVAFTFAVTMAFSTVPTPLYLLYQQQIGFGQFMVTVVFAAFAVGVVISLFLAGHLSDAIGRRRVLLPAILVEAVAAALFLVTPTLPGLITARFLSGIGIGLVVATATAYLSELHLGARPAAERGRADLLATVANMGGIGLGPLVSGLLAQYVTGPLRTPYLVFLMLLLASAVAVALVPETVGATRTTPGGGPGHPAALRYRPRRAAVPVAARPRYFAATAAGFTAFAVLGLFTSLAPSFVADTLDHPSRALAGAVAFLVFGMAGTAQVLLSRTAARRQIITGLGLMAGGLVPVTVAVWVPSLPVFLAGGAVAGAGAGVLLKGAVSTAAGLAEPSARGAALAGVFLAGYAGLTVPVLALGVATQIIAVQLAMLGFAGVVLVAIAAVGQRLLRPVPVAVADAQMSI